MWKRFEKPVLPWAQPSGLIHDSHSFDKKTTSTNHDYAKKQSRHARWRQYASDWIVVSAFECHLCSLSRYMFSHVNATQSLFALKSLSERKKLLIACAVRASKPIKMEKASNGISAVITLSILLKKKRKTQKCVRLWDWAINAPQFVLETRIN